MENSNNVQNATNVGNEVLADVGSGYSYAITRLKAGSSFYGNCEVCGEQVDTTYFQDEYKAYKKPDGTISRTQYGCRSLFGHETCLLKSRR